jgi:hypothetical protein
MPFDGRPRIWTDPLSLSPTMRYKLKNGSLWDTIAKANTSNRWLIRRPILHREERRLTNKFSVGGDATVVWQDPIHAGGRVAAWASPAVSTCSSRSRRRCWRWSADERRASPLDLAADVGLPGPLVVPSMDRFLPAPVPGHGAVDPYAYTPPPALMPVNKALGTLMVPCSCVVGPWNERGEVEGECLWV